MIFFLSRLYTAYDHFPKWARKYDNLTWSSIQAINWILICVPSIICLCLLCKSIPLFWWMLPVQSVGVTVDNVDTVNTWSVVRLRSGPGPWSLLSHNVPLCNVMIKNTRMGTLSNSTNESWKWVTSSATRFDVFHGYNWSISVRILFSLVNTVKLLTPC